MIKINSFVDIVASSTFLIRRIVINLQLVHYIKFYCGALKDCCYFGI